MREPKRGRKHGAIMRAVTIICAVLLALFIAGQYAFNLSGSCGHEIYAESVSPDGRIKASLDEVNCGATTAYAQWVLIIPAGRKVRPEKDVAAVFVKGGRATGLEWTSSRELYVNGVSSFERLEQNRLGVTIVDHEGAPR